jgi:hypothetical protein
LGPAEEWACFFEGRTEKKVETSSDTNIPTCMQRMEKEVKRVVVEIRLRQGSGAFRSRKARLRCLTPAHRNVFHLETVLGQFPQERTNRAIWNLVFRNFHPNRKSHSKCRIRSPQTSNVDNSWYRIILATPTYHCRPHKTLPHHEPDLGRN